MTTLVRQASAADLLRVAEIAMQSASAAHWNQSQYEQMLSSDRILLVAEEEGQIIGFLSAHSVGDEWEIENIAVIESAQNRGAGSRLMEEFLHHVRSNGGNVIFLEVRESNRAARALYERWAFVEAGRRRGYYQDPPEDALVLKFYFPLGG